MKRVAAVGFCCVDNYANLNRHYPTGNGVDCVLNMSKKGVETAVVSVVGTDRYGDEMFDTLRAFGVDSSHLQRRRGDTSFMVMNLNGNDRVHVQNILGVMEDFTLSPEDIDFIETYDFIHTDYDGRIFHLLPRLRAAGCQIIFDCSVKFDKREDTQSILQNVDYAFLSYNRKDDYILSYLKKAQSWGPKVVVASLGENGSIAYDGNRFYEQPVIPVEKVVNTVGAGDAFCSGFMTGVILGKEIPRCLLMGTMTSHDIIQMFNPY
ncbi:MAG: fructoselysine 6-kinase [Oscillospiraceae bacterium]|nr:fructoselysine 6-kinase [Oscillospiraceae bacterium]